MLPKQILQRHKCLAQAIDGRKNIEMSTICVCDENSIQRTTLPMFI